MDRNANLKEKRAKLNEECKVQDNRGDNFMDIESSGQGEDSGDSSVYSLEDVQFVQFRSDSGSSFSDEDSDSFEVFPDIEKTFKNR